MYICLWVYVYFFQKKMKRKSLNFEFFKLWPPFSIFVVNRSTFTRSGYISQGIVENNCPHKWNYLKAQQSITNLISIQWNYMRNNRWRFFNSGYAKLAKQDDILSTNIHISYLKIETLWFLGVNKGVNSLCHLIVT